MCPFADLLQTFCADGQAAPTQLQGITAVSVSSQAVSSFSPQSMLNYSPTDNPWRTSTGPTNGQYTMLQLAGGGTYPIDRARLAPDTSSTLRVRDFAIDVSTTTTDDAAFTTVPKVSFHDQTASPTNLITAWSWQFGDGTSNTEQNPAHTYAALVITTSLCCDRQHWPHLHRYPSQRVLAPSTASIKHTRATPDGGKSLPSPPPASDPVPAPAALLLGNRPSTQRPRRDLPENHRPRRQLAAIQTNFPASF